MSRSFRKNPIVASLRRRSDRGFKQDWHKKFRHKEKIKLKNSNPDDHITLDYKQVSNIYCANKTGKHYYSIQKYKEQLMFSQLGYIKKKRQHNNKFADREIHKTFGK